MYLYEKHVALHGLGVHELPHLVDVDERQLLPLVVGAEPPRDLLDFTEPVFAHDGLDLLQARLETLQLGDHHRAGVVGARLEKQNFLNGWIQLKGEDHED